MDLCKYRNALGEPRKGIHSYRLFGVAIADIIMTILGSFLVSYFFKISFTYTMIIFFGLGIFLHHIFCVKTTVDKLIFNLNYN